MIHENLQTVTLSLFEASKNIFWHVLPLTLLFSLLLIYISGEFSGAKIEGIFKRVVIAIILLCAFPTISDVFLGLESELISAFGGDASLNEVFGKIANKSKEIKDSGGFSWFKLGEVSLSIISTLSFLILSIVKRFFDVLHLTIWNLLHILAPISLLGCVFPSFNQVPKGIFMGLFELALWKPMWVILMRILLAIGFNETPTDPSKWLDFAIMNFAVAGLIASTPMLVHGFLSGQLVSMGAGALQTMVSGAGAALSKVPANIIHSGAQKVKSGISNTGSKFKNFAQSGLRNLINKKRKSNGIPKTTRNSSKPKHIL